MLEGFSPGNYVVLVEYTGRLFRDSKAVISPSYPAPTTTITNEPGTLPLRPATVSEAGSIEVPTLVPWLK